MISAKNSDTLSTCRNRPDQPCSRSIKDQVPGRKRSRESTVSHEEMQVIPEISALVAQKRDA